MGGSSSSTSSSASNDNRLVVGEGGLGITGSGSSASMTVNNTTTNQIVDGGLIGVADAAVTNALQLANESGEREIEGLKNSLAAAAEASARAVAAAQESARQTTEISRDAMSNVSTIADRSQGYAWESASEALGMTSNVIAAAFKSADNLNDMSLATVRNVADAYQSARETEVTAQFQDYRYIMIAGMAVVAIVAFKAVK